MVSHLLCILFIMHICSSIHLLPQETSRNEDTSWNSTLEHTKTGARRAILNVQSGDATFGEGLREKSMTQRTDEQPLLSVHRDKAHFIFPRDETRNRIGFKTSTSKVAFVGVPLRLLRIGDSDTRFDGGENRMRGNAKAIGAENPPSSQISQSLTLARKDREPVSTNDHCYISFDAAANIRNELFFIKLNSFWRINTMGLLLDRNGMPMSSFWTDFPNVTVDAAFTRPSNQDIVFIAGNQYWVYSDHTSMDPGSPRSICDFGLCNEEKIECAVVWRANKQVYIFGQNLFWKLDDNLKAEIGYPKMISELRGLPRALDAAVEDTEGYTYFLRGQRYWKLDDDNLATSINHSEYIGSRWFGCNSSAYEAHTISTPLGASTTSSSQPTKSVLYFNILLALFCAIVSKSS